MKEERPVVTIRKEYHLKDCVKCPDVNVEKTEGAGYAQDYICPHLKRTISGYVEWDRDLNPVPDDCPLRVE